jgi:hypothetical protein
MIERFFNWLRAALTSDMPPEPGADPNPNCMGHGANNVPGCICRLLYYRQWLGHD